MSTFRVAEGYLKIQQDVQDYMDYFKYPYWDENTKLLKLDEECGELAREIAKAGKHQVKKGTPEMGQELSDVLFALVCIANPNQIRLAHEYNNQLRIITDAPKIKTLNDIQSHIRKDSSIMTSYRNLAIARGKLAEEEKPKQQYHTGKIGEYLVECVTNVAAISQYSNLNLQKEWNAKMEIRYGRDKGRFKQA